MIEHDNLYFHFRFQLYKELNLSLSVVYVETWNRDDKIEMRSNIRSVLQQFVTYKQSATYRLQHDNTQLFTWVFIYFF